jgi:putative spermidine/putrescine transport system ATP-binding protein
MAQLEIRHVSKVYGDAVALSDASISVEDGEFLSLLGPSGCGKTTLLRIIAGITVASGGEVLLGEKRIDALPPERRNIGLVFQSYALFPHMTVKNNVAFGLKMRGVSAQRINERVQKVLELVDLALYGERYPRQLSGGQQQRVALARAVVIEPEILLLDEPLSNLDAKLREQLREDLRTLQRKLGTTAIYVTHDQAEALAVADRIVVMNQGHIIEVGSPSQLYREPKHRFTAQFLGQTNLIDAVVTHGTLELPWGERRNDQGTSGRVTFSVRPEDIRLEFHPEGKGVIDSVTFLGSVVQYQLRLHDHPLRVQRSGHEALLRPGELVNVFLPEKLHALQRETKIQHSVDAEVF